MKTYVELYDYLQNIHKDTIIDFLKDNWKGKDKLKAIFRLFAYLKLITDFNDYDICKGNFNNNTIKPETELNNLIRIILLQI